MDGTNLNCHDVIESYEALIKELTQELHGVKCHHEDLKSQLSTLVSENQDLTQKLHEVSKPKSQQVFCQDQDDVVGNLRRQIESLVEEKNYLSALWRESMETVRVLEQELEVQMAGRDLNVIPKKEMEKLKQDYEEKILKMKLERPDIKNLPPQRGDSSLDLLTASKFKLIVQNLEEEILTLQKRLQEGENGRKKLEKSLREKEVLILDVLGANGSYREKVLEAVKVVEEALHEKEETIAREKQAREELQQLRQNFERKLQNSQDNLTALQSKLEEESKLKTLEIEKLQAKCSLLENHLELLQSERLQFLSDKPRSPNDDGGYANKLLVLEKNLESTFQKLLVSEKQNIQLSSEKETLKNDMEQMAEHYERTLKAKEIERVTFQSRLKQLETKLEQSQDDSKELRNQLETTVEEWKKRVEEREKSITQQFTAQLDQLRLKTKDDANELRACLETKNKFVKETKIVLENLEKLAVNLKRENRKLKTELRESQTKHQQYRNVLKLVHDDVDRITTKAVNDNDDYVWMLKQPGHYLGIEKPSENSGTGCTLSKCLTGLEERLFGQEYRLNNKHKVGGCTAKMRNVIVVLTSVIMLSMFLANVLNTDGSVRPGTGTTTGEYVSVADSYDDLMWFLQITDIHISIFNDPERITEFHEFCDLTLRSIEPAVVLASGDLTDARTKDSIGSEQFEKEWIKYRDVLQDTGAMERTVWLDIRGNHDNFNVADHNSKQNFFTNYSVQGKKHPRSYMYQVKRGRTVYSFIGIDACLEPGPRRPFNFIGTLDDVETREIESLISQAESSLSNYTIFFGHFPSSCILHVGSGRHLREMIGGHRRGMAYLCGHLHRLGGLVPEMYTRQDPGFLELELGDWKDNRVFRLLAFDQGLFSFVDVEHRSWPVILVTNPKHALFVNTARENLSNMRNSTHIRILAFSLARIEFVRVKVNGGSWIECRRVKGPLYVAKWNTEKFLEGMHNIEVYVGDIDGRTKYLKQPFSLDGTKLHFGFLSRIALRSNASLIFRLMFFITLMILVLPLLLLRYFHYLVTAGKLKKPRPRRSCWFGVFRKLWILSTVDKLFVPIVLYPIYLTVGPWSIGYLVEDHIGAIFAWGILVNGAYLPGAFTYVYGFTQLITFQLPLTFIMANAVNYRFERLTTKRAYRPPTWIRHSLFHTPFAIVFTLQLVMAYLFWMAYGTMAFLLGPLRTWSLGLAAYMYYSAITLDEKSIRRATEMWHVTADVTTQENMDTSDREK